MPLIDGLRHRVTLESKTVTRDPLGGEIESWAAVAIVWAEVLPLQGREFFEARRLESELDSRIRIRYRSGVVPGMRITWGSRTYGIESVVEHESGRRELRLMCRELGLDR